jgi:hypothetical protein
VGAGQERGNPDIYPPLYQENKEICQELKLLINMAPLRFYVETHNYGAILKKYSSIA